MLDVDVIIVNYNRPKETILTINSLRLNNKLNNIILIDNGSDDISYLDNLRVDKIIKNSINMGQAKAINQGLFYAHSKYIITMHNDVVVNDINWIRNAIHFLEKNKKAGLISLIGWKKGDLVTSLLSVLKTRPEALKWFDIDGDFVKVGRTDSFMNIFRNLGIKADTRFGLVGISFYMDYLNQGYELYVMKVSDGTHLPGSSMDHNSEEFIKQQTLMTRINNERLKEFKEAN